VDLGEEGFSFTCISFGKCRFFYKNRVRKENRTSVSLTLTKKKFINLTTMKPKLLVPAILVIFLSGCSILKPNNPENLAACYRNSIGDAMSPDSSKICYHLVPINKQNDRLIWKQIDGEDYLLVVTWKQNINYYKPYLDSAFYDTGSYPIWVTTAPELAQRMKKEKTNNTDLRIKQLLGLPPTSTYSYFVEFWVKPEDLFRPCPDKEITDQNCALCFPQDADSTHIQWINSNRIDRYYQCDWHNQYPWTQLGYTYDWNPKNKNHIGFSEFVIGAHKKIVVKAIYPTREYLQRNN